MIESATRHETLARAAIAVVVALAWGVCAYILFVTSQPGDSVLSLTDVDVSKPAAAIALYERLKSATAICAGGRTWMLKISARRLRGVRE